jgi:hypothetical protein
MLSYKTTSSSGTAKCLWLFLLQNHLCKQHMYVAVPINSSINSSSTLVGTAIENTIDFFSVLLVLCHFARIMQHNLDIQNTSTSTTAHHFCNCALDLTLIQQWCIRHTYACMHMYCVSDDRRTWTHITSSHFPLLFVTYHDSKYISFIST